MRVKPKKNQATGTSLVFAGKVKTPFEQAKVVGTVGARWLLNPCYMHSFAMTDNYWVIIEQPLVVSVPKILKVLAKQDALIDALQWFEKEVRQRESGLHPLTFE
uniref:Uncharacterized protein n=1 Tax=Scylla olivacea TaxID=85551 RepID=A0A0N7Z9P9_SCYOL